ncbi:MAG TPA: class I SAM-dependent methyltransferase [Rubrobacteraceae bacterium]|nr:class I SAM-dependent methyltransferase [Rubrobacteraceae bacterium]
MLYKDQAAGFDERAAIPAEAVESMAAAVAEIAGLRQGEMLLEIGPGTGMLSLPLLRRPIRYIGFDRSPAMLAVFREKVEKAQLRAELLVADGNGRWPAEDGSVAAIFSARALHHVDVDHAATETIRVLGPEGGWLILGMVRRPNGSVKPTLRRQMRKLLEEEGYSGRNHHTHTEALFSALEAIGGERAEPHVVAHWMERYTPLDSITAWEGKEGLAGHYIPQEVKERVLGRLRAWAEERHGNLKAPLEQKEFFELDAIHMRAA